jgi:ubiquinone/menaquinone biosynthesis C-methylase UbiE
MVHPADDRATIRSMTSERDAVRAYYDAGPEYDRLDSPLGVVEFERTKEILQRHPPPPPARIADIGGGPGRYAVWLMRCSCLDRSIT